MEKLSLFIKWLHMKRCELWKTIRVEQEKKKKIGKKVAFHENNCAQWKVFNPHKRHFVKNLLKKVYMLYKHKTLKYKIKK